MRTLDARITGDDRTARRMTGWTVSVTVVLTALLEILVFLNLPAPLGRHVSYGDRAKLLLYLIPQALAIAVPIGIHDGDPSRVGGPKRPRRGRAAR